MNNRFKHEMRAKMDAYQYCLLTILLAGLGVVYWAVSNQGAV